MTWRWLPALLLRNGHLVYSRLNSPLGGDKLAKLGYPLWGSISIPSGTFFQKLMRRSCVPSKYAGERSFSGDATKAFCKSCSVRGSGRPTWISPLARVSCPEDANPEEERQW